jgi:LmbE family N-acetylglucosaminyl deacetylase
MNILVVAPHPDDEAIGCGGTLCKHSDRKDRTVVVFLTSGEMGLTRLPREQAWRTREGEAAKAVDILGVTEAKFLRLPDWHVGDYVEEGTKLLQPVLKREKPEIVYLPNPHEWHPDHRAAVTIVRSALRRSGVSTFVLGYEVWTPIAEAHHTEDITKVMPRKLRAIRAHRSQLVEIDYVRATKGLNQYRGEMSSRFRYAEVFQRVELDDENG